MSKQVGLTNSGSEAHSDSSSSGSVTVKVASAFSGGTWAWVKEAKERAKTIARSRGFMAGVTPRRAPSIQAHERRLMGAKRQYRAGMRWLQRAARFGMAWSHKSAGKRLIERDCLS